MYVLLASSDFHRFLRSPRHDAREMVEEILAGGGQDHGMGDLSSMFSRRDVCCLFNLPFPSADVNERIPWIISSRNSVSCRLRSRL